MRGKQIKKVVAYVVVFAAGACVGVVAGIYVAWVCCLNLVAVLLLVPVGVRGW